jgi:hypothetical protein
MIYVFLFGGRQFCVLFLKESLLGGGRFDTVFYCRVLYFGYWNTSLIDWSFIYWIYERWDLTKNLTFSQMDEDGHNPRPPTYHPPLVNSDHSLGGGGGHYQRLENNAAESSYAAAPAGHLQNHVQQDPPPMHTAEGGPPPPPPSMTEQHSAEVKSESGSGGGMDPPPSDATMQAIMAFLRRNNLMDTETKLKEELKKREATPSSGGGGAAGSGGSGGRAAAAAPAAAAAAADQEVGNVLASYKSEGDPTSYEAAYKWVPYPTFRPSSVYYAPGLTAFLWETVFSFKYVNVP